MSGLKLLSWNMNQKTSNWQTVLDSGVDIAMLQEAKAPPAEMAGKFMVQQEVEPEVSTLPWRAVVAGIVNNDKYEFREISLTVMKYKPGSVIIRAKVLF